MKAIIDSFPVFRRKAPNGSPLVEAARIELGIKAFLEKGDYKGFTDTFEDLHGLVQLPGVGAQRIDGSRVRPSGARAIGRHARWCAP